MKRAASCSGCRRRPSRSARSTKFYRWMALPGPSLHTLDADEAGVSMSISQRVLRDATVIHIDEVFTYRNRKDFSSAVTTFKESQSRHLIVNLYEATYVDSAAIGLLALTSQQLMAAERRL